MSPEWKRSGEGENYGEQTGSRGLKGKKESVIGKGKQRMHTCGDNGFELLEACRLARPLPNSGRQKGERRESGRPS